MEVPQKIEKLYVALYLVKQFRISNIWRQPKYPLIDEWAKNMGVCVCVCVCIMEYYSAMKKNDLLLFAATWMDLEGIKLNM